MSHIAFEKTPNFPDFPVLFDHTVVSTAVIDSGPTIRCGNGMALSASKKGLPIEGQDFSKFAIFMQSSSNVLDTVTNKNITNGQKYTKQLYEYVDGVRVAAIAAAPTASVGVDPSPYNSTKMQAKYLDIGNMSGKVDNEKYTPKLFEDMCVAMIGGKDTWGGIIEEIFDGAEADNADRAIQTFEKAITDLQLGVPKKDKNNKIMKDKDDNVIRKDPAYKEAGRVDKLYQVFFDNKVWGTQLMGGFQVPTGSRYHPILSETLKDDNRVLKASTKNKNDNLSTAKKMIYSCVPNDGILFLCESPLFAFPGGDGKWEDEGYTGITVEKNAADGKVYSAIWKGDQEFCEEKKDIVCQINIIDKKGKEKKISFERGLRGF